MGSRLIPKTPEKVQFVDLKKSAGILDDYAVRKNVATKEGTIEKVPVNSSDIVNKAYADSLVSAIPTTYLKLDQTASQTITASPTLNWLTASQALMTDANKKLISVDYLNQAVKTTSNVSFNQVSLPLTTNTAGIINQDSHRFIHTFAPTGTQSGINIFIGYDAGNFTISQSGQIYHGSGNIGVGYLCLNSLTYGYYNTAVGSQALQYCQTGTENMAFGLAALRYTTGSYNAAIGVRTMVNNTSGRFNMAIGSDSLYYGNFDGNVGIGYRALYGSNTGAGNYNIAIGYVAGAVQGDGTTGLTSQDYCTYLGSNTRGSANNVQNEIAIGYLCVGMGSNTATLGSTSVTASYIRGSLTIGQGTAGTDYSITIDGETNDGVIIFMEDEDYFKFSDDVLMDNTEQINFNSTSHYINSDGTDLFARSSGILRKDNAYAEIYVADGASAQTIGTGATYTKLTGFTTNGEADNCTADAANDKITITKAGKYRVNGSFNFTGDTSGAVWRLALFYDGTEISKIHIIRKIGASGDAGSASFSGILSSAASKDIDVRGRHDGGGDETITLLYANLNVVYIGE